MIFCAEFDCSLLYPNTMTIFCKIIKQINISVNLNNVT